MVRQVRIAATVGFGLAVALLIVLDLTVGLGIPAFLAAGTYSGVLAMVVGRTRRDDGSVALGPADLVTLSRAVLIAGVTALVVQGNPAQLDVVILAGLSTAALVLDAVDGYVARRTGTMSRFGARFDMEIDAFLILVLSIEVARTYGAWVLGIGAARYAMWVGGRLWPWLAQPVPFRYWRKVVAAVQGIVLTGVIAGLLPGPVNLVALVLAAALLAESFGRDVWWLWKHRARTAGPEEVVAGRPLPWTARRSLGVGLTVLAFGLVWAALAAPDSAGQADAMAFLRIPVEGLVLVAIVLIVPPRAGRILAVTLGVLLALLTLLKGLDIGFGVALDRPFDPVSDWAYLGPAMGVLADSIGRAGAIAVAGLAGVLVIALLALVPLASRRVAMVAGRHRVGAARAVAGLSAVWIGCALLGLQLVPGAPVASADTGGLAYTQVGAISTDLNDQQAFAGSIRHDPLAVTPTDDLLTALRGKDVLIVFVESYGKVALTDPIIAPGVRNTLIAGTGQLAGAGFSALSGYLTSPTFGGISWLAHATLQSGLWIDSQLRYNQLVASDRLTLSDAFHRAGWRTVGDVPSNYRTWPEGTSFYHYDQLYDAHNVGYLGPEFSYAQMPDQYVFAALQRLELAKPDRDPVMAEVDLVSSHTPWAPLPTMVAWDQVGDGTVFAGQPSAGHPPASVWSTNDGIKAAYGQSIQYSLTALTSFMATYPDPNLVVVMLGDHQPASVVSGTNPSHDVPISVIAHDPAVLARINGWGWTPGLTPAGDAPVWPMDSFRDRFLTAFGQ